MRPKRPSGLRDAMSCATLPPNGMPNQDALFVSQRFDQ